MTDFPTLSKVELDYADGWLTAWFNEPQIRNPLSSARAADLMALCDHLHARRDVRGVVLRGRGAMFCAGGDLKAFKSVFQGGGDLADVVTLSKEAGALLDAVAGLPQYTVMAVEGAAMAGGFGLACVGDVVIAEETARFALSETAIGLTPAQIAPFVIRRLGATIGRRLMITAETVTADDALGIGLADEIATGSAGVDAAIERQRVKLKRCAPGAVAETKKLLRNAAQLTREEEIEAAAQSFARCLMGDEGREGVAAFIEKRKPRWARESEA